MYEHYIHWHFPLKFTEELSRCVVFACIYIWLCIYIHISIHTDTIHIHILNIGKGTILCRCIHLHPLHYIYKKKHEKRKKEK